MAEMVKDWQALDARIARELLNCVKWDELTDEEQDAVKRWRVWRHYDGYWWQRGEGTPCLVCGTLLWQPHQDVAQALMVKNKIMRDDWCFDLSNRPGTLAVVYFWQMLHPMVGIQGKADTDAQAICLATEAWLDAQKELSGDLTDPEESL